MKEKEKIEIAKDTAEDEELALQSLYEQVVLDTKDFKSFLTFFKQATKRIQTLQEQYYSDVEDSTETEEELPADEIEWLHDDPVFEITAEQESVIHKLLLAIAKHLNQ